MKKSRFSETPIVSILKQGNAGIAGKTKALNPCYNNRLVGYG